MTGKSSIEVRLPDDLCATGDDLDLLRRIFDAIVALRCPAAGAGGDAERALAADGWSIRAGLMWVAEGRRGSEYEQVTGASRAEALAHLQQLVEVDTVRSVP
jgi:hypothetical protein